MQAASCQVDVQIEIDTSDDRVIDAVAEMLLFLADLKEHSHG